MDDDICRNYHGGNPESEGANQSTAKAVDRGRILAFLKAVGPRTCDEIEVALALAHQTASARCSELLRDGLVRRKSDGNGSYQRRRTRRGALAAVLMAPAGVEVDLIL